MIRENELLIVDGMQGVVIVDPDPEVLAEYRLRQEQMALERQKLKRLKTTPSATLDGTPVELHANIELPEDIGEVQETGAQGIGLFRTEFLFMNRKELPAEDEQFEAYREVAKAHGRAPGGDPHAGPGRRQGDRRTAARWRCRTRRWACARSASAWPSRSCSSRSCARSCAPRTTARSGSCCRCSRTRTRSTRRSRMVKQAKQQLDDKGIAYDTAIQVGGMIEVPAAALALPMFMRRAGFPLHRHQRPDPVHARHRPHRRRGGAPVRPAASGGAAPDRAHHPGRQPRRHAGRGVRRDGGRRALTRLLLGFGLRKFSMHAQQLLAIKERVLRTNLAEAQPLAQRVLGSPTRRRPASCSRN